MKIVPILLFSVLLCPVLSFAQSPKIIGDWKGTISFGGQTLTLLLHLKHGTDNAIDGTLDSPDQGATGIPLDTSKIVGDSIFIQLMNGAARYCGYLAPDSTIDGTWSQGGINIPLHFKRDKAGHPKNGNSASPYEKEISIPVSQLKISGTLLSKNKSQPVVLLIAGSGPTDRNGNSPMGVHTDSYKLLADTLLAAGIATFRYDKRMIGKSIGHQREEDLNFDTYVEDAIAIFHYLKDSLGYKKIFIAGHSEGALTATIAAQKIKTGLQGLISISGTGSPIDQTLKKQLDAQGIHADSILARLKNGETVTQTPPGLQSLFRPSVQPFLISWMKYDPAKIIATVKIPILIEQGNCDVQVAVSDAETLHKANPTAILHIIPQMTHTLKNGGVDCKNNQATYTDATLPIHPELVKDIESFVLQY